MKLTVDLDTLQLIAAPTDKRQIAQIDVKRGDSVPLAISFVRDGVAEELTSGSVITFGAKESAKYDGTAAILCSTFAKTGTGTTAVYTGTPSLNTAALNSLLEVDSDDSNDVAYVDLMGELTWTDGPGGDPVSTSTFRVRVNNDVIRGDESGPASVNIASIFLPSTSEAPNDIWGVIGTGDSGWRFNLTPGTPSVTVNQIAASGLTTTVTVVGDVVTIKPAAGATVSDVYDAVSAASVTAFNTLYLSTDGSGAPTVESVTATGYVANYLAQRLYIGDNAPYWQWECCGPTLYDWIQITEEPA